MFLCFFKRKQLAQGSSQDKTQEYQTFSSMLGDMSWLVARKKQMCKLADIKMLFAMMLGLTSFV